MLVKLKHRLRRATNTIRRPFRRNKREKLSFHDFHVDWDGLKSFSEVLDKSPHAYGPLKSAVDELWRCIEMFESSQRNATTRSRDKYEKLGIEINDLFRVLSNFFGGTSSVTHESAAKLAREIENETKVLQSEQPAAEQDVESGKDVQGVLGCYRRVWTLLGRFALNEDTNIWNIPDESLLATRLDSLPHSPAVQYRRADPSDVRRTGCMPNTRMNLLQQLRDWVNYNGGQRIYWLNGLAGTGKTAIAYSFCEQLESSGKLAASFFCSRLLPACRDVRCILPSISYQLSSISRPFRCAVSSALEDPEVHNLPISEQLAKLVAEPLLKVKHTFPANMVIVIDGLDECEDVNQILDILLRLSFDLHVKLFITSRPTLTILTRMRSKRDEDVVFELSLHEADRPTVREDIGTYLATELKHANLSESDIASLIQRSRLFFGFAAAIVNYIGHDNFSQGSERLNHVLAAPISSASESSCVIDLLYDSTLQVAFDNSALDPSEQDELALVLHMIAYAQEPLTVDALAGLLKIAGARSVDNALLLLQPLLQVSDSSGLVTSLHESFQHYLLDQRRSDRFYCKSKKHHARLAQACFDLIAGPSSPFNICKLESSYLRDREVPSIDQRVKEAISPELLYACRYWGAHIESTGESEDLLNRLHEFLAMRLLLWMEILNLNRCMGAGISQLHRLRTWLKEIEGAAIIQDLAHDAWKFVVLFSLNAMTESTPHIYVSMLPFWPKERPVSKYYTRNTPALVKTTGVGMRKHEWAALTVLPSSGEARCVAYSPDNAHIVSGSSENTIRIWDTRTGQPVGPPLGGHTYRVYSVAYSPNGAYIASGSRDETIRIWDAHTGQPAGRPLGGHSGSVRSVAYSPNGAYIVSGSDDNTVRIWDAHTGQPVGQPLEGHTWAVSSVVYSPNGAYIMSGSRDNTIRIWDAHTGQPIGQPLEGHRGEVYSVACSPNGAYIVSGSQDKTIRIWDAHTGQPAGQPLEGHTWAVSSVVYSPNGAYIMSGSRDKTIRIWDAHTGQPVGQPLEDHGSSVISVAYSANGAYMVSGSDDNTIRIWDAHTGQSAGQPLEGHTYSIISVAYSPNGAYIVSGSDDNTIRIWDAHSGQSVGQPLKGHTNSVRSVAYSPNGAHIVSGSWDKTIRIWDAHTGQPVGQPLTLEGHGDYVYSVAYSPNGACIVSGSADTTIRIWDVHTGQPIGQPLKGHTGTVFSVAYSPNGAYIVSGSRDKTIRIWDAHTGQPTGQPLKGHAGPVYSVVYSPNGAYIASNSWSGAICIWDAHTWQPVGQPLQGHARSVKSVAYSPNGAYIVSGSEDKTVCIWDAHTGQPVGQPLVGHTDTVWSVAYSPNGAYIVSGSSDMTIRIWNTHQAEIMVPPAEVLSDGHYYLWKSRHPLSHPVRFIPPISETVTGRITQYKPNEGMYNALFRLYDMADTLFPQLSSWRSTFVPPIGNPLDDWTLDEQGWVVDAEQYRLIWVPHDLRDTLLRAPNTAILSRSGSVKLDFSSAKLGEDWGQCFDSKQVSNVN